MNKTQNNHIFLSLFSLVSLIFAQHCLAKDAAPINLAKTEKAIVKQVNNALPEAIKTLKDSVKINSGTMNFAGVKQVGKLFQSQFEQLGLTTQWVDGEGFGRAGHLTASYGNGKKGIKILMIGHLDTVFSKTDQFQDITAIDERYIAGPGITDMKGGDVIIIEAIRALKSLDLMGNINIKVVMTGDEEKSGRPLSLSKKAIIDAAKWADIALGFEDGDGDIKTAVTSRRGSSGWSLDVTGKPAHSSQIFREDIGFGAIYETARILNEFRVQLTKESLLTVNPGIIIGGTRINLDQATATADAFGKGNVISKTAKVTGDIRAISPAQLQKARKLMKQIVSKNLPHTSAEITFTEGYPPMAQSKGNMALLKQYSQVSQDLGYGIVEPVDPRRAGAADISFAANHVDMALDGLGLMGDGGHTKDEVADMDSFAKNIQKAAILIYRLSAQYQ